MQLSAPHFPSLQVSSQLLSASASLQTLAASLPSSYQAKFAAIIASLNASIALLNSSIGWDSAPASGVLGAAAYTPVHQLYVGVKGEVCCQLPDQVCVGGRGLWGVTWILPRIYYWIYAWICCQLAGCLTRSVGGRPDGMMYPCRPRNPALLLLLFYYSNDFFVAT